MSFLDVLKKTFSGKETYDSDLRGKAALINKGMMKAMQFYQRGIDLNPVPDRKKVSKPNLKKCPNHSQVRPRKKYFFRIGDFGLDRHGKPKPFTYKEI